MRLVCVLLFAVAVTAQADLISEWAPNPPSVDPATQYLELSGTPGAAFSWEIVAIEGDSGASPGTINFTGSVSGTYDAAGIAVISGLTDFENPSYTFVLLTDYTGTGSEDVDSDDDGAIDSAFLSLFSGVEDAIGTMDIATDLLYADDLGGTNMAFVDFPTASAPDEEPTLIFRATSTGALYQTDGTGLFDSSGASVSTASPPWSASPLGPTSGTVNPTLAAVPEPSSIALLGVVGLAAAARRRRAA